MSSAEILPANGGGQASQVPDPDIAALLACRIAEQWCMFDDLARLQQLGVTPEHLRKVLKI